MRFGTRLIVYYLAATLLSMTLVGLAVRRGIEYYGMLAVEQDLMAQSESALVYVTQALFLAEPQDGNLLHQNTARQITDTLSAGNRQVRIYDQNLALISASVDGVQQAHPSPSSSTVLAPALAGNYAYVVRNNNVFFSAPISLQNETLGLLEFVYPLHFLNQVLQATTRILLVGAGAFSVLIALLSTYIGRKMVIPIKQLVAATGRFSQRNFSPIELNRSDELGQLGASFNRMGAQLQDYIQRQREFVATVSHELRTPLTAISGYTDYLQGEIGERGDLKKALYHLRNESDRLTKLVTELLLLARIDAQGSQDLELAPVELAELVQDVVARMGARAQKYGVAIESHLQPDLVIAGDREKLTQALINLIDNAIKFSPAHSHIEVSLRAGSDQVSLTIADQGPGIPPGERELVFERFYRAANSKGVGGTGLGLAITKEIIAAHQGGIFLHDRAEGGTLVEIILPPA